MNNENKYFIKFLILVGILIAILIGYAGFNFFNISGIFNEKPIYYFCSYHDDYYLAIIIITVWFVRVLRGFYSFLLPNTF